MSSNRLVGWLAKNVNPVHQSNPGSAYFDRDFCWIIRICGCLFAIASSIGLTFAAAGGTAIKEHIQNAAGSIGDQIGTYGAPFSSTLPADAFASDAGNGTICSASGLPPGITLNAATRTLSGTPTSAGKFRAKITVRGNGAAAEPGAVSSFTFTANKAVLTVTASNTSRAYGSANPAFTGRIAGVAEGDRITANFDTSAARRSPVGEYAITPTLQDPRNRLVNYTVTAHIGTLTVTKAPLTITADSKTKVRGGAFPLLTATYHGFIDGDTSASLDTPGAFNTPATTQSGIGAYPITITGTMAANYTITVVPGTLRVTPANAHFRVVAESGSMALNEIGSDCGKLGAPGQDRLAGIQHSRISADRFSSAGD